MNIRESTYFDHFDLYYLANELSAAQLRREIQHAEVMVKVDEIWRGTPYADINPFPWNDYAEACREALDCINHYKPINQQTRRSYKINAADIKAKSDIVSIISGYTELRKTGNVRFTGKCPLHEDNHPSLTVYADKQNWHCFQCSKGGDIFEFIKLVHNCDFKEATAILGAI